MSLNFWDTLRGNNLADTLIRELPKITDLLKGKEEKEQFIVTISRREVPLYIKEQLMLGRRYMDCIDVGNGDVLIIMEIPRKKVFGIPKKQGE